MGSETSPSGYEKPRTTGVKTPTHATAAHSTASQPMRSAEYGEIISRFRQGSECSRRHGPAHDIEGSCGTVAAAVVVAVERVVSRAVEEPEARHRDVRVVAAVGGDGVREAVRLGHLCLHLPRSRGLQLWTLRVASPDAAYFRSLTWLLKLTTNLTRFDRLMTHLQQVAMLLFLDYGRKTLKHLNCRHMP